MHAAVIAEQHLATRHGTFHVRVYRDHEGSIGAALWQGDLSTNGPVLGRVHSSCFTSEALGALDCDCREQLDLALRAIASHQRGVVIYLLQEGRGAGLLSKALDRMVVQTSGGTIDTFEAYEQLGIEPDPRTYRLVPAICKDLQMTSLRLMTNNPAKIDGLASEGLHVEAMSMAPKPSPYNFQYLMAKARSGHTMDLPNVGVLAAPQGLESGDPQVERFGNFLRIASYDVPIGVAAQPVWFRATAYSDQARGYERLILSRRGIGAAPVLEIFRDRLFERLAGEGQQAQHYSAALIRIVTEGSGSILAIPDDPAWFATTAGPSMEADAELLRRHDEALRSHG